MHSITGRAVTVRRSGAGQELVVHATGSDVLPIEPALGAPGIAPGTFGSGSTSAYATKGLFFIPDRSILVSHLRAYIDTAGIGDDHYAQIGEVSGTTGIDEVSAALGTNATIPSSSLEQRFCRLPFTTAVLLETGKTCSLAAINAPDDPARGTSQFDSVGVGQASGAFGTAEFLITVEVSVA